MGKLGHLKGEWGFTHKPRKALLHPTPEPKKELGAPCTLALWVNTHLTGKAFRAQLARWKLTNSQFRDFLHGHWDIPSLKLWHISKDTGIPMETLCQEHAQIAVAHGRRKEEEFK